MRYRRVRTPCGTYFFTVVTYRRRPILCDSAHVDLLREAITIVRRRRPFAIDAFVLLPDHLHCIWTLPSHDCDYSTRWMLLKSYFTRRCTASVKMARSPALRHKREQTIWQHRYWEHEIRDDRDFERHCDYIHFNPVKHRQVGRVADWPYSSFHRFVRDGTYPADWSGDVVLLDGGGFGE